MEVYIYKADIYCADSAKKYSQLQVLIGEKDSGDSEQYPQGPYSDGGGEADNPQHCGDCNMFLENSLTSDGDKELKIMLSTPPSNGIADIIHAEYRQYYDYLFA